MKFNLILIYFSSRKNTNRHVGKIPILSRFSTQAQEEDRQGPPGNSDQNPRREQPHNRQDRKAGKNVRRRQNRKIHRARREAAGKIRRKNLRALPALRENSQEQTAQRRETQGREA